MVTLAIPVHSEEECEKLYAPESGGCPSTLSQIVRSHRYPFSEIIIAHKNGLSVPDNAPDEVADIPVRVFTCENSEVSQYFGLELPVDPPELVALWNVITGYVVFNRPDCLMVSGVKRQSWIQAGIERLKRTDPILVVTPHDGDGERMCSRVRGDIFLAFVSTLMQADLDGDGTFDFADRLTNHMTTHRLYACVLGGDWLYWKFGANWQPEAWKKKKRGK